MAGGINRPVLPTTGTTPDEQRLRSGLGAIVRSVLDSGAFLNRLFPGKAQAAVVGTGTQVQLAWGDMNRLPPTSPVVAFLPRVTAKQIGVPLVISKAYATGVAMVQPAGVGIDGRTQPTVDGLPTGFQMSEAGQRTLMTDGANWFSQRGGAGGGGAGAAVSTPSGVFPTASAWKLTSNYSPIGLWQFNETLDDTSGLQQPPFSINRGSVKYTDINPGVKALVCGGPTGLVLRLPHTGVASLLRTPGDISVQMIVQQTSETLSDAAGSSPLLGYRGRLRTVTGNDADNSLWGIFQGPDGVQDWYTEAVGGAGFSAFVLSPRVPPPGVRTLLLGARRAAGVVQHFLDGKPLGSVASGATPGGGSSGVFWLGGQTAANESAAPQMVISSLKICNNAMSDAQFLDDYNASLGQVYGSRY